MPQSEKFRKSYPTFESWKKVMDRWCENICGCDSESLPDYPIWDAYSSGEDPGITARDLVEAAKEF